MTSNRAIEILADLTKHDYWTMTPVNSDAIKLGIEALKFYEEWRAEFLESSQTLLPGETTD